ncbi:hypothetical protein TcasGA2_TC004575 [Tribolium castaneum]|uniref:DDE Tnp4 domain-containing protein n=1 Tax=Tribolium castaneum TaxID=7070 RepID=D6WBG3_TRICA|nr:hypothetical protein TcasGA2_TC004575 [Tribolium castaneum]
MPAVPPHSCSTSTQCKPNAHIKSRNKIESIFGILKRRFPSFNSGLRLKIDTIVQVVVACGALHNICKKPNDHTEEYFDEVIEDYEKDFIYQENNMNNVNFAV